MAVGTSTISVSIEQLDTPLSDIASRLRRVNEGNISTFMGKLCEMGQNAAQRAFGSEVSVTWTREAEGYSINANGQQVCFLEFGAGLGADPSHPFADDVSFTVAPGSWSQTLGKGHFVPGTHEWWRFQNHRYERIPSVHGMYDAFKEISENAAKTWQEVMG